MFVPYGTSSTRNGILPIGLSNLNKTGTNHPSNVSDGICMKKLLILNDLALEMTLRSNYLAMC